MNPQHAPRPSSPETRDTEEKLQSPLLLTLLFCGLPVALLVLYGLLS